MIDMKQEMNRIILFFTIKHKGNWEHIYSAIKQKDPVTLSEIKALQHKYADNYISIIDQNYPNNYKDIYMPPLSIFTRGRQKLLARDDEIISIWELDDYKRLNTEQLDKKKVYALFYDDEQVDNIDYLLANDYQLILVGKHNVKYKLLDQIDFNKAVVFISEIPFEVNHAEVNDEQTDERNLLGIGQIAITFNSTKAALDRIIGIFKFEERKLRVYNEVLADSYINHPLIDQYKKQPV